MDPLDYIPNEFGRPGIAIPGVNIVSKVPPDSRPVLLTQDVTCSKDYNKMKQGYPEETSAAVHNNDEATLTRQLGGLSIYQATPKAISLRELSTDADGELMKSTSDTSHQTRPQEEYIPSQYGSYPNSSSIFTFTKSNLSVSLSSKSTNTTETNISSSQLYENRDDK